MSIYALRWLLTLPTGIATRLIRSYFTATPRQQRKLDRIWRQAGRRMA